MARVITYFGLAAVTAMGLLAACGGGDSDDENGNGNGNGTGNGDGDGGPAIDVGGVDPGVGVEPGGVVEYDTPEGFKNHDDGTGNPSYKDAGIAAETVTALVEATTSASAPAADENFAYPLPDTMVPWNLNFIEFQWKQPANSGNHVLIRAEAGGVTYHLYVIAECTNSGFCFVELPKTEFQTIGLKNLGGSVTFEVFSTQADGTSKTSPVTMHYSPDKLIGTLYFWASAERTIKRVVWGAQSATDFIIPKGRMGAEGEEPNTEYECVSCHSVSRDGTTIAFGVSPEEGENISGIQVARTADPYTPLIAPTPGTTPFTNGPDPAVYDGAAHGNPEGIGPTDSLGHNVALNTDGTMMAVNATGDLSATPTGNWPSALQIKSTTVKDQILGSYEVGNPVWGADKIGIQPEWSPNSDFLAVALGVNADNENLSAWAATLSSIAIVPVTAAGQLGNAIEHVMPAPGYTLFYPTWSPDSKYLAFVGAKQEAAPRAGAKGSLNNERGVIYMVPTSGGPYTCPGTGCTELTRGTGYSQAEADAGNVDGSTWPKFAPFPQGDSVYYITLTANRQVGARPGERKQLWMFGIDTSQAGDPSYAPFWIPYQEYEDVANLAPYWTETPPCDTSSGTCEGCLEKEVCAVNRQTQECRCDTPLVTR